RQALGRRGHPQWRIVPASRFARHPGDGFRKLGPQAVDSDGGGVACQDTCICVFRVRLTPCCNVLGGCAALRPAPEIGGELALAWYGPIALREHVLSEIMGVRSRCLPFE